MKFYGIALLLLAACSSTATPEQPLPFSHAVHAGQQAMTCVSCHQGVETRAPAGLPSIGICLRCHMRPQGDSGRDEVVRERAAKGGDFRWVQVTRNAGHVYFSHRAHVTFAQMPCTECHGEVSTWAEPPTQPTQKLVDMDACMSCHRKRDVSNECKTCHR